MGGCVIHEEAFYGGPWEKRQVEALAALLRSAKKCGEFEYSSDTAKGVKEAKEYLTSEMEVKHSDKSMNEATKKLHDRHEVWEKLMHDPRVAWDKDDNKVYATPNDWEDLLQEDWRICWYEYEGEPLFEKLGFIFGPKVVQKEPTLMFDGMSSNGKTHMYRLNKVKLPPLPEMSTPGRKNFIYISDSPYKTPKDARSPFPMDSPGVFEVSDDEFNKSVSDSAKKKSQKKLFGGEGNSPPSSEGSSPGPLANK